MSKVKEQMAPQDYCIDWQPIESAPKTPCKYLLGYDANSAEAHGSHDAGLCIIEWVEADEEDEWDEDWRVMPFSEGLDVVLSDTRLTHWMPLPLPPALP